MLIRRHYFISILFSSLFLSMTVLLFAQEYPNPLGCGASKLLNGKAGDGWDGMWCDPLDNNTVNTSFDTDIYANKIPCTGFLDEGTIDAKTKEVKLYIREAGPGSMGSGGKQVAYLNLRSQINSSPTFLPNINCKCTNAKKLCSESYGCKSHYYSREYMADGKLFFAPTTDGGIPRFFLVNANHNPVDVDKNGIPITKLPDWSKVEGGTKTGQKIADSICKEEEMTGQSTTSYSPSKIWKCKIQRAIVNVCLVGCCNCKDGEASAC